MNRRPQLTDREKRTLRIAGLGIAIYLVLFGGFQVWKSLEQQRADYRELAREAQQLRQQTLPYRDRVLVVQKLMASFHLDPARQPRATLVSDASAAMQSAAKAGGVQLGPIRETMAHGSGQTLASMQLESSGPAPAVLAFLAGLNTIGFPLVVDAVQFTPDNNRPGQVKMSLTILILDFDQQKETKEGSHA
jgi:hypothetical protein